MKKSIFVVILITLMITTSSLALAGSYRHGPYPSHYRGHHYRSHHYRPYYRHHGDYWAALGIGLFAGAVVSHLFIRPPAHTVVYEQPAPVVVEKHYVAPPSQTLPTISPGKVAVSVGALNVRSGPSLNHAITTYVRMGDVLQVSEFTPEWLYVRTPDGQTGWVMAQFTRAISPSAG